MKRIGLPYLPDEIRKKPQLKAMTNDEIRAKIAESLDYAVNGLHPKNGGMAANLPNYPESLDACAEFEKTLTWGEQDVYKVRLSRITADDFYESKSHWSPHSHHASAKQRCLAYLKTKGITQ